MDLGPKYWKVQVTITIIGKTPLYRMTSDFYVLDDEIGSTIAWPKNYVALN